jgi:hypothetical protein
MFNPEIKELQNKSLKPLQTINMIKEMIGIMVLSILLVSSVSAISVEMCYPNNGDYRYSGDNVGVDVTKTKDPVLDATSFNFKHPRLSKEQLDQLCIIGNVKKHVNDNDYYIASSCDKKYQKGYSNNFDFNNSKLDENYLNFYFHDSTTFSMQWSAVSII